MDSNAPDGSPNGVDLATFPAAAKLVERVGEFMQEVQNLTPGKDLERRLNRDYGPGNLFYDDFCSLVKTGIKEGWAASGELDGPKYRRGKISPPSPTTLYMSITTVFFDSQEVYAGQYHKHPYGEINCVVPIDPTFELEGLPVDENWQGAGWTSLAPGTHHYPRARGGKGVALFFLPSGRIAYDAKPGEPQPAGM